MTDDVMVYLYAPVTSGWGRKRRTTRRVTVQRAEFDVVEHDQNAYRVHGVLADGVMEVEEGAARVCYLIRGHIHEIFPA